jgi:hypothetical protein
MCTKDVAYMAMHYHLLGGLHSNGIIVCPARGYYEHQNRQFQHSCRKHVSVQYNKCSHLHWNLPSCNHSLLKKIYQKSKGDDRAPAYGSWTIVMDVTVVEKRPGWIPENLNHGHLDRFFFLLAGLTTIDLVVYFACAKWYKNIKIKSNGEDDDMQMVEP